MKKVGDLVELQAALAEKRNAFVADALQAEKEVEKSGLVYRANDVHRYIRDRALGKRAPPPKLVKR